MSSHLFISLASIAALFFQSTSLFANAACTDKAGKAGKYALSNFVTGLSAPLRMVPLSGTTNDFYVVEHGGKVRSIVNGKVQAAAALDLTDRATRLASINDERGLLGLALHPDFTNNGRLFVNYTTQQQPLRSRISEFKRTNGVIDKKSEQILIEIPQQFPNHNGGDLAFGPDGYLYAAFGDEGSGGDPKNNAQNLGVLYGKILRIDVNGRERGLLYKIPPSNPFVNTAGVRPEIFAYGLRNPWRMSFDRATGLLWAGDVGQNKLEEIDIITSGANYGWKIKEGSECFNAANCKDAGLTGPIAQYDHDEGISVTGGYVYRGQAIPSLVGKYLFSDFATAKIWAIGADDKPLAQKQELLSTDYLISSYAEDNAGELYIMDLKSGVIDQLVCKAS